MKNLSTHLLMAALVAAMILIWLLPDDTDDSDIVTIEYRCSMLHKYENVPDDVEEECGLREKVAREILQDQNNRGK